MEWDEKAAAIYVGATACALTGAAVTWGVLTNPAATLRGVEIAGMFAGMLLGLGLWVKGFNWFLDRAADKNAEKAEKSK